MGVVLQDGLYILAGAFAGLMSGLLGIGGGVIVVPSLLFIFEMNPAIPETLSMHMAAATSLAVILFTSVAAIGMHHRIEPILWWVYRRLSVGIILGTICGALLMGELSNTGLKILFALFLLFVAYRMSRPRLAADGREFPGVWLTRVVSLSIGLSSGLLGVGGGVMIVPYLSYCGVDPRRIAPISSLCTLTVASMGTLTFLLSVQEANAPAYTTGYVYWPAVFWVGLSSVLFAPWGAKLSYVLPLQTLRYGFVVILLLTVLGLVL